MALRATEKQRSKRPGGVTGKGFMPGQSGNPGGRPKVVAEVRALARQHTAEVITTLLAIMRNPEHDPRARVAAAKEILDRGYGRPSQPIEGDDPGRPMRIKLVWDDGGLKGS